MYTEEDHWINKQIANKAMQLEETVKELKDEVKNLTESKDALYKNYSVLKEKYNNAIAMLHGTESIKQEVVVQPELFDKDNDLNRERYVNTATIMKDFDPRKMIQTLDKPTKSNDNVPHFIMKPTRRRLTTEQAQHVWNMVTMGNARMVDMAKKFGCHEGTIHNVMSGVSYKEVDRSKQ